MWPRKIGIVKPNKAKLEIFSKSFFTCFVWEIWKVCKKSWKVQKTYVIMDMQQLWYQTEPNCETNCYLSFGDHLQSHNPTSLSQVFLVMISVVGSLLGSWAHCWWKLWMAVSNRSWLQWQVLMQWWVVAEVTSGCSQGQHNQLCLHAKCGLWAKTPAVFLECRGLLMIWFCHDQFPQCAPCCQQQLATNHLYMYVCIIGTHELRLTCCNRLTLWGLWPCIEVKRKGCKEMSPWLFGDVMVVSSCKCANMNQSMIMSVLAY